MKSTCGFIFNIALAISFVSAQTSFGGNQEPDASKSAGSIDSRLGLLASSLGVDPVPGASYPEGSKGGPSNFEQQGVHGGNGGGGGIYPTGGVHGGNGGGKYPTGGGVHGGNTGQYPISPGGGRCECVPKQYCSGRPGSGGGVHGGNSGGDYGGGKGNGEYIDPGLTTGHGPGGSNPETDGSGNIDIRIVNRPPSGVNCLPDQIYCCEGRHGGIVGPKPEPGYDTCGVPKIIDVPGYQETYGQADFGEYPWMAVILSGSNNYLGAGALLDSYHVLTVAHKVQDFKPGFPMKVRFGEWNAKDDSEPFKNVEIDVARVDIHPNFNSQNLQNDVAVIKLAQPIDITAFPHIKSVCLPKHGGDYVDQRCWVPGFGKDAFKVGKHSFYLREVDVPVVGHKECEARLRSTRLGPYFELNRKSFLCAGGEEGKDACTGDGGSPLVCQGHDGRFSVVGLVAWGIGCADYGIPGVYVNVPNYVQWIESKLAY